LSIKTIMRVLRLVADQKSPDAPFLVRHRVCSRIVRKEASS
jgi:hypothetical protein